MPLYALGFMGMTRRLSQQIDPQFHTMLMIAASGAVLIALGISASLFRCTFLFVTATRTVT